MIKGQRKGESLRPRLLLLDCHVFFAVIDVAHAGCDEVMCRATVETLQGPHDAGVDEFETSYIASGRLRSMLLLDTSFNYISTHIETSSVSSTSLLRGCVVKKFN